MNYSVSTIPLFDKQAKRLAKKYPSLKADLAELLFSSLPFLTNPKEAQLQKKNCKRSSTSSRKKPINANFYSLYFRKCDKGSKVIFEGVPENLIKEKESYTGQFLKERF